MENEMRLEMTQHQYDEKLEFWFVIRDTRTVKK